MYGHFLFSFFFSISLVSKHPIVLKIHVGSWGNMNVMQIGRHRLIKLAVSVLSLTSQTRTLLSLHSRFIIYIRGSFLYMLRPCYGCRISAAENDCCNNTPAPQNYFFRFDLILLFYFILFKFFV